MHKWACGVFAVAFLSAVGVIIHDIKPRQQGKVAVPVPRQEKKELWSYDHRPAWVSGDYHERLIEDNMSMFGPVVGIQVEPNVIFVSHDSWAQVSDDNQLAIARTVSRILERKGYGDNLEVRLFSDRGLTGDPVRVYP